ncbi:MAG: DUF2341 domain-containing protein [archaeon]|nr:DUF2341 domain-containing protein [archaeon]
MAGKLPEKLKLEVIKMNKRRWAKAINALLALALVAMLMASLLPQPIQASPDPDWYNASWACRKKITIDYTKVAANLNNFSVLINITDPDLRDTAHEGHVGKSNGGDILFTSSDGTTKLSHEIEKYVPSTGELVAWVKVPTLSASNDTEIYIYYGNANAGDQWDPTGVWDSNFKGVWHLKENATGIGTLDLYNDSTSNANHGDDYVSATGKAGKINDGQEFDGVDDYVDCGNDASLNMKNNDFLISEWVKVDGGGDILAKGKTGNFKIKITDNNKLWVIIDGEDRHSSPILGIYCDNTHLYITDTNNHRVVKRLASNLSYVEDLNSLFATLYSSSDISNNWNHIAIRVTHDSPNVNLEIYLNGVLDSSVSNPTYSYLGGNNNLKIGGQVNYFNGTIDEVRISNTARSDKWISTTYNNQKDPATFYDKGPQENRSGMWVQTSRPDFEAGVLSNLTTTVGDVKLATGTTNGTLNSSTHNSGGTYDWGTISWNATIPAGASLKFQIRTTYSDYDTGFVGPNGSSNDYYETSGQDICSDHNGYQCIQYKAYFNGTEASTPTLYDVTITYNTGSPLPPIPELPSIFLLIIGLAALAGYLYLRTARHKR